MKTPQEWVYQTLFDTEHGNRLENMVQAVREEFAREVAALFGGSMVFDMFQGQIIKRLEEMPKLLARAAKFEAALRKIAYSEYRDLNDMALSSKSPQVIAEEALKS
jgi:hypothetical protein